MADPIPVPPEAVTAARSALANLPTGTSLWGYELTNAATVALEAGSRAIRADERERIANLASERQAIYLMTDCAPGDCTSAGQPHTHGFADLIRGGHD